MPQGQTGGEADPTLAQRRGLVSLLKSQGVISSPIVESAFLTVPRHLFVPNEPLDKAYVDVAIPVRSPSGEIVGSGSQPAIVAAMLEQLDLEPGHRVLQIGTGSGFNAALMAHIVGESGHVTTVDIVKDNADRAGNHLSMAGFDTVNVVRSDGGFGHPEEAPYDRIVLTVASSDILPPWVQDLDSGGRLLLPLMIRGGVQVSVAFERGEGHLTSVSVTNCGFTRLRGAFAGPEKPVPLGDDSGVTLLAGEDIHVDTGATYGWLAGEGREWDTGLALAAGEVAGGLAVWLATRRPDLIMLIAEGEAADAPMLPDLFGRQWDPNTAHTYGLLDAAGLCFLARQSTDSVAQGERAEPIDAPSLDLKVMSYGDGDGLAKALVDDARAWDEAGRPATEGLQIRAYAQDFADHDVAFGLEVVNKRWTRLVCDWK